MKKHFIFCALAALALSSCVKENASQPEISGGLETITFEAAASADTKTTLVDGTKVYWTADDQISVMGAAEPFTNALAAGETAAKTAFTGEVAAADTYYAVYPASGVTWNGTVATTSLVTTQVPVKGTFSNGYNVTVAKTTSQEKSFPFKNVLGYVKFSLTETTLRSVIVTANGGECLTGKFTVDAASDDPEIVPGTGRSYVQFTEYNVRSFSEGDYYIALLPGTYSQGLTFEFENKEGVIATARLEGPVTLEAGNIQNIGSVDSLTWDEKEASENVIWTGKFFVESWKGCQDLAWGGFDWSRAKAGDVLKVYGGPESDGLGWWCICLKDARNWENLPGSAQYDNPTDISLTLTQEMIDKLVETEGLVLQGQDYVFTKIELVPATGEVPEVPAEPAIPDDYEAITIWEGSTQMAWGTAMQALAYGGYNWATCKPGQYLKLYVSPTDPTADWTVQLMYADAEYAWQVIPSLNNYNNVEEIVLELTEDLIALFAAPNSGFIMQGNNATAKKVELYREPAGEAGYALTMTNATIGENWSVQVWYTLDEPLKAGSKYEFKCVAKSTEARDWCSVILQSADGNDQNFSYGMNLFTEWTPTTITFEADKDTYTKITFNIGDFAGTVSIDNVSMKEVGSNVELINNGDFENGSISGWSSWTGAQGIGEGYYE